MDDPKRKSACCDCNPSSRDPENYDAGCIACLGTARRGVIAMLEVKKLQSEFKTIRDGE